jgi:hypothetical protein
MLCRAIAMATVLGATLTGCSLFGSDDSPQPASVGYPRSWIWYAEPGIALTSANARTVRAWVESETLYQDSRVSYPGFIDATSPELLAGMNGADSDAQGGGTDRYLIRSLSVRGDELRASLCSDGWDEFGFTSDGSFVDSRMELAVRELVMRKTTTSTGIPPAAVLQQSFHTSPSADPTPAPGRLRYDQWLKGPTKNEFNGWVATGWDVSVTPPADCVAWFKRNHPGLKYPSGYPDDAKPNRPASPPPPTLPASPGW